MQLFYSEKLEASSKQYILPKDESKHIIKVLRKTEGDTIYLTNGKGHLFKSIINQANSNKCSLTIKSFSYEAPPKYKLHLAVAPTKLTDRYEWFLEKATEIGVTEITPLICQNSERKIIKENRCNRILKGAMKQSLQCHLPTFNHPISFKEFMDKSIPDTNQFIAHCEEDQKSPLKDAILKNKNCSILIGPEGDFSPDEIKSALSSGYKPVTLGNNRLRTETAAVVACHTFNLCSE